MKLYLGRDASLGGSTAINAAGGGWAAATEIICDIDLQTDDIRNSIASVQTYFRVGADPQMIEKKIDLADTFR